MYGMSARAEFLFIPQESTDSNDVEISFSACKGEMVDTKVEEFDQDFGCFHKQWVRKPSLGECWKQ